MKVIELLVKMANKEKLPKKILIHDKVYYLLKRDDEYIYSRSNDVRDWERDLDHSLNICICLNDEVTVLDKVEILEDKPKKIEYIDTNVDNTLFIMQCYTGIPEEAQDWNFKVIKESILELQKDVNYLLEKSDNKWQ